MAETSEQNWEEQDREVQDSKQPEIEQPAEQKTEKEKFAGAIATYTIEALMHDGKDSERKKEKRKKRKRENRQEGKEKNFFQKTNKNRFFYSDTADHGICTSHCFYDPHRMDFLCEVL